MIELPFNDMEILSKFLLCVIFVSIKYVIELKLILHVMHDSIRSMRIPVRSLYFEHAQLKSVFQVVVYEGQSLESNRLCQTRVSLVFVDVNQN